MGKTSKPVQLMLDKAIFDAAPEQWAALADQGHIISILGIGRDVLIVAPYAMRMTAAMVTDLPKSIELLIKGARALQHSPAGGNEWTKGKPKRVANTNKGKRKNKAKPSEGVDISSEPATGGTGPVEGEGLQPVGQTSFIEGNG